MNEIDAWRESYFWPPPTKCLSDADKKRLFLIACDLVKHIAAELQVSLVRRLNFVLVHRNYYEAHTKLGLFVVSYDRNRDRLGDLAPKPWRTMLPLLSNSDSQERMVNDRLVNELWSGNKSDAMKKAQAVYEELISEGVIV